MLFEPAHLVLQETEVGDTEKENIREIERERERERGGGQKRERDRKLLTVPGFVSAKKF